jgi:uncharacterized protein YdhG (YjbR/CyaY superfamily)
MSLIDEYFEKVSVSQKAELERIRTIVKQAVPEAEEVISYGMPAFKYNKKYLIGFAAFKNHMSIFPTSGPIEAVRQKLDRFELAKGTIQFTIGNPIPEPVIQEILSKRLAEISKT